MAGAVAARLDHIKSKAGVRSREIAQLLGTTPQTVSRWQQGHVDPQPTKLKQLLELEWLAEQLREFYEPDEARLWLFSPHRLLGGETPADKIQAGNAQDVLALIDQLRDGAFV
jgi:transcriptional regulator with XRE-family HTH domain